MVEGEPLDGPVGFVGLGDMGFGMARAVLDRGFSVIGTDRRDDPLRRLGKCGGEPADTPAAVAERCRSVHVVVVNDEQVRSVVAGPSGLFPGFRKRDRDCVVAIHSTVLPETCEDLAAEAPANVSTVDAPISGGPDRAESGELTVMVGGDETAVDFCGPVFDAMARDVFHVGDLGSGQAAKLAHNTTSVSNLMTTIEGLRLGEAYGIDRETLLDIFERSAADSFMLRLHREFLESDVDDVDPDRFDRVAMLGEKDLYHALELAKGRDVDLVGAAVASQTVPRYYRDRVDRS